MANNSFQLFKPIKTNGLEIYVGEGALGYDSMTSGYPLKWTTRQENKGRLYRKSDFTFRTIGYTLSSEITKTATVKQKGQPIFSIRGINLDLQSVNNSTIAIPPTRMVHLISLTGTSSLSSDCILNILNETNAQWLEISIDYDPNDSHTNGGTVMTLALLGDTADNIYDGGNRSAFLNKIRESLYYEFSLSGLPKLGGYLTWDDTAILRFMMYYKVPKNESPTSNFTDFMGIGTRNDFINYITSKVANGDSSVENATYTLLKIKELSSTRLELVGSNAPNPSMNYQDYYKQTKILGETNTFKCKISFNSNPTYTLEETSTDVHYFNSFADPTNINYYLGEKAFIFHIIIKPRGFAKKWSPELTDYNYYYQWNYAPYDIKVVIMLAEPIPYLEFNNSTLLTDDFVLLGALHEDAKDLPVNSNMQWNIESLVSPTVYDVERSEIEAGEPLYIEHLPNG